MKLFKIRCVVSEPIDSDGKTRSFEETHKCFALSGYYAENMVKTHFSRISSYTYVRTVSTVEQTALLVECTDIDTF
jgi:hypothetical protein